jgi:hypothetical protein
MKCDEMSKHEDSAEFTTTDNVTTEGRRYEAFLKPDEVSFVRICEAGKLYETLMERMEFPARSWAKYEFFEILFGHNHSRSQMKADFTEDFPNVAEVVRVHKRKDYASLSRLMQNIESNFVINTVCRRLMKEHPDTPVLTIHDCILTTPPHVDAITGVMREEFARLGLSPTLKVKRYDQATAGRR